jgi:hypothetical protein
MGQAGEAAASAAIPAFSALRRVYLQFAHPSAFIIRTCQSSYDPVHASVQQCASREKALETPIGDPDFRGCLAVLGISGPRREICWSAAPVVMAL